MLAGNCLGLVTAHFAWSDAAGLVYQLHPTDRGADSDPKLLGCPIAGHAALNRPHNPVPKIKRVRSSHPCCLLQPACVNQKQADLRIPNRFNLNSSRSSQRLSDEKQSPDRCRSELRPPKAIVTPLSVRLPAQ